MGRVNQEMRTTLHCRGIDLPLGGRTLIMGILNLTPDSFSGDGLGASGEVDVESAIARAIAMVADGADLIDIGGESTRPGSVSVEPEVEIGRVVPAIERLSRAVRVPISIDTRKARVAEKAMEAGAQVINDITALRGDPEMAGVAARYQAPVIVMHMQGEPRTMQHRPAYRDLIGEISSFLRESVDIAVRAGVPRDQVVIDPGVGFGKLLEHNLEILRRLGEFASLGQPILVGASRKAFIGRILDGAPANDRVEGTIATTVLAIAGGADIVRVHDVRANARAARVADSVVRGYHSLERE